MTTIPQTKQEVNLFQQGYRCTPFLAGLIKVTGGTRPYMVDLAERHCDCPAIKSCKHLKGAIQLIEAQIEELYREYHERIQFAIEVARMERPWETVKSLRQQFHACPPKIVTGILKEIHELYESKWIAEEAGL